MIEIIVQINQINRTICLGFIIVSLDGTILSGFNLQKSSIKILLKYYIHGIEKLLRTEC